MVYCTISSPDIIAVSFPGYLNLIPVSFPGYLNLIPVSF